MKIRKYRKFNIVYIPKIYLEDPKEKGSFFEGCRCTKINEDDFKPRPCAIFTVIGENVTVAPITSKKHDYLHLEIEGISKLYNKSYIKLNNLQTFSVDFMNSMSSWPYKGQKVSLSTKDVKAWLSKNIICNHR